MRYEILYGFEDETIISSINKLIKVKGYDVNYAYRVSKDSIHDYILRHRECNTVVLIENLTDGTSFNERELSHLTDQRDINVIIILDEDKKGSDFVQTIYAANILSAIFIPKKEGASPAKIAYYIMHPRNRKAARKYYGIQDETIELDYVSYDTFLEHYSYLMDQSKGANMIDRYVNIVSSLTPKQAADFTKKIPGKTKHILQKYEEFYEALEYMKKKGVNIVVPKRPEHVKRGLTDRSFNDALKRKKRPVRSVRKAQTVKKQQVIKPTIEKKAPEPFMDFDFFSDTPSTPAPKPTVTIQKPKPVVANKTTKNIQKTSNNTPKNIKKVQRKSDVVITKKGNAITKKKKEKKPRTKILLKPVLITLGIGVVLLGLWYLFLLLML